MFDSVKPEFKLDSKHNFQSRPPRPPRRPFPWKPVVILTAIPLLAFSVLWPSFKWLRQAYLNWRHPQAPTVLVVTDIPRLEGSLPAEQTSSTASTMPFNEKVKIEYLSFSDFYKTPAQDFSSQLKSYSWPINVKTDTDNYYETSRQFDLDPALAGLNNDGLGFIANPWDKDHPDFLGLYDKLVQTGAPVLITADFINYYYQNSLKQTYQDIESRVFFDNLWTINKGLYLVAKDRYETRFDSATSANDPLKEGARQELAYLAVALELLKPTQAQINLNKDLVLPDKFNSLEAESFNYILPAYLKSDVDRELKLIREAKAKTSKSPVLFYAKDYTIFAVPKEYRANPRLNNFYLAARWLNALWPLNYKSQACPDCLLDKDDWRVSLTAAALLSKDLGDQPELKQRWARIYKIIYFFKGLREDYNYVYYRDRLSALFGPEADPMTLFATDNKEAEANLEKWRQDLLQADFSELAGGFRSTHPERETKLGLKFMADFYWPNDYIFSRLTAPAVGAYQGSGPKNVLSGCWLKGIYSRCHGLALDAIGLVQTPDKSNNYWRENTDFKAYADNLDSLRASLSSDQIWHSSGYWSTLAYIKIGLDSKSVGPEQSKTRAGRSQTLKSALAALINWQLPLDKWSLTPTGASGALKTDLPVPDNIYIEPRLNQIQELAAESEMITEMFKALNLSEEANVAVLRLQSLSSDLNDLAAVIKKELSNEALSSEDKQTILAWLGAYKTDQAGAKQLSFTPGADNKYIKEDLSRLKLMLMVNQQADRKFLTIGPVFDYQESRP